MYKGSHYFQDSYDLCKSLLASSEAQASGVMQCGHTPPTQPESFKIFLSTLLERKGSTLCPQITKLEHIVITSVGLSKSAL